MSQATQGTVRWTRGTVKHGKAKHWYQEPGQFTESMGYRAGNLGIFYDPDRKKWNILHQPSGLGVACHLRTLTDAKRLGIMLLTEFDHTVFDRTANQTMEGDDDVELNRAGQFIRDYQREYSH